MSLGASTRSRGGTRGTGCHDYQLVETLSDVGRAPVPIVCVSTKANARFPAHLVRGKADVSRVASLFIRAVRSLVPFVEPQRPTDIVATAIGIAPLADAELRRRRVAPRDRIG